MTLLDKLKQLQTTHDTLSQKLLDPTKLTEVERSTLYSDLDYHTTAIDQISKILKLQKELEDAKELLNDKSMHEMALVEIDKIEQELSKTESEHRALEVGRKFSDPDDTRSAIIEIRAGAGGDEAGLFASDLLKMYQFYATSQGWSFEIISTSVNESGGYKEIIGSINGKNVFKKLKYESGVHRVQRIPVTESKGRIHTSTVSVAILPEAKEIDVQIKPEDIKIDVMRATGAGGQCVNTTDSAVRITHIPTGIVVSCQETKHQLQNRQKAMAMLLARIYDRKKKEEQDKIDSLRAGQVGKMMRAEKIRTYNYPQNRITDHRVKLSWHNLDGILGGNLEQMLTDTNDAVIQALIEENDSAK